jgi:hypothetical protein
MDVTKENIIKFIDAMIVDNYSKAHKFLEVIVQENVKAKIKKAKNLKPFGEGKKKKGKKELPAFLKKGKKKEDGEKKDKKDKKELPDFIKKIKGKKSKSEK